MTSQSHVSGTDRLQEVCTKYGFGADDIVVNVQGDEPLIPSAVIDQVADNLNKNPQAAVATLSEPIIDSDDFSNPNIVKVVKDKRSYALYFSRASIPHPREKSLFEKNKQSSASASNNAHLPQRHIGIYAYRVRALADFVSWPVAHLEAIELLEQLRFLENGQCIHVEQSCQPVPAGVDTPEDLARLNALLAKQPAN